MSSVCVQVEILPHSKLYNKQQTETNLDQPRPTQTNPDQPRPSKTNQDQPRPTKTNQDQPRPTQTNPVLIQSNSVQFSPIQSYSLGSLQELYEVIMSRKKCVHGVGFVE